MEGIWWGPQKSGEGLMVHSGHAVIIEWCVDTVALCRYNISEYQYKKEKKEVMKKECFPLFNLFMDELFEFSIPRRPSVNA